MLASAMTGVLAAFAVSGLQALQRNQLAAEWSSPIWVLAIAALAMVIQRYILDPRPGPRTYDGMADLLIQIHSPSSPDSSLRWLMRGVISALLALCSGTVGVEGAAIEWNTALALRTRPRSARWFEQRRRTDSASALAAGIAASFGAPYAGILLPLELGIGGRTLSSVICAFSAFLATRYFDVLLGVPKLDVAGALYGAAVSGWHGWGAFLAIGALAGLASAVIVRMIRYSQESLLELFQTQTWIRTLAGGAMLFCVLLIYRPAGRSSVLLFHDLFWTRSPEFISWVLVFAKALCLALVLSAFGTVGLFWPLFALGGFFGCSVAHSIFSGLANFAPAAALSGAAAFWGAVLGAPISGAVLAYELTDNLPILLPCFLSGLLARELCRRALRTRSLIDRDLEARGLSLIDGRSKSVLDTLTVRDAMIADFETVHEQEPIGELYGKLLKSRYPFLPVVRAQGLFAGLLTIDMVQDSLQASMMKTDELGATLQLSRLIEVKDLLQHAGFKSPTVKANDRLSVTQGMFDSAPCVPVLGDDGRVLGLLFVHHVRLAYEREVARRALTPENREA